MNVHTRSVGGSLTEYGPRFAGPNRLTVPHSHSIVAGGLEEMS